MPTIYIIAGCNGAGKTTAAYNLLPKVFDTIEFVNADEIAIGLSPFNVEGVSFQAARIMIERLHSLVNEKKSFAFETTLSGLAYLQFINEAKAEGYEVILFFIWIESIELAKSRVAVRVNKGGHNIPESVIERRYKKGIKNFSEYTFVVNSWYIFDNSGTKYFLIAKSTQNKQEVFNFDIYNKIVSK